MEECANCGISESKTLLFDVISDEGIVKMCGKCKKEKNLPEIKKFSSEGNSFNKSEPRQSVYERLSKLSGYKKREENKSLITPKTELSPSQRKQDEKLKEIVNQNASENLNEKNCRKDLVNNFHWIITRKRRMKKITKEELAREISEPEILVDLAEKGLISKQNDRLVKKLENYLKIRIRKEELFHHISDKEEKEFTTKKEVPLFKSEENSIDFKSPEIENLRIGDLKKIDPNKKEN